MELKKQTYLEVKFTIGANNSIILRGFLTFAFISFIIQSTQAQDLSKYHALFIGNFIKYVEWPTTHDKLTIGVAGSSKTFEEMKKYLERENKTKVRKIESIDDCVSCQIIFLPTGQEKLFEPIKKSIANKDILLVTEEERFAEEGASISFFLLNGKLRFIVNKSVSEAHNLKISSGLLRMAKVI